MIIKHSWLRYYLELLGFLLEYFGQFVNNNLNYQNDPRIMVERNENATIIESSYEDIVAKIIKKDTFILYIHQNGCLACKAFTPIITKYVEKYKVPVYSVETSLIPKERSQSRQKLLQ